MLSIVAAGLDSDELMRLVVEGLPITSFNSDKLGKAGIMMAANSEEGLTRRNSMYHRVKADAFVPAGGRPNTMNVENWRNFLDPETGAPSSSLIVEGANIFTTPEARLKLYHHGVTIVKDSSANKCGVITSSKEIATSMLLSKEEFVANKDALVVDVLKQLREAARAEGELLFRTYANYPGNLPHFSERISFAIGSVTDALTKRLADVQPGDPLWVEMQPLVLQSLPEKLAELAGDRVADRFPVQYQRNAMACMLASKLVYKEGIHFVESQPVERIAERAIMYQRAEKQLAELLAGLPSETSEATVNVLKKGGARTLLGFF